MCFIWQLRHFIKDTIGFIDSDWRNWHALRRSGFYNCIVQVHILEHIIVIWYIRVFNVGLKHNQQVRGKTCDINVTVDIFLELHDTSCPLHCQYVIYYKEKLPSVSYLMTMVILSLTHFAKLRCSKFKIINSMFCDIVLL